MLWEGSKAALDLLGRVLTPATPHG
jgi:hypothetical protein